MPLPPPDLVNTGWERPANDNDDDDDTDSAA